MESASPFLTNTLVAGNLATSSGAGFYLTDSSPDVVNAVLAGNEADLGAGMLMDGSSPSLTNVAVVGNVAVTEGGGLLLLDSEPVLNNTLVVGNSAISGGGIVAISGSASLTYCDVWDNAPDNYLGLIDPTGTSGNLSVDPLLLDLTGADPLQWDLHLDDASNLVDAGDPGMTDPDGGTSDVGPFGGAQADGYDLDDDGFPSWWQPGPYDALYYPPLGYDCDDLDADVHPGTGC